MFSKRDAVKHHHQLNNQQIIFMESKAKCTIRFGGNICFLISNILLIFSYVCFMLSVVVQHQEHNYYRLQGEGFDTIQRIASANKFNAMYYVIAQVQLIGDEDNSNNTTVAWIKVKRTYNDEVIKDVFLKHRGTSKSLFGVYCS